MTREDLLEVVRDAGFTPAERRAQPQPMRQWA